jgi:hypothetical protein
MSKLQAPDKELTVRFSVDRSEFLHRKLSMLAAKTGRKKVDQSADAAGGRTQGSRWIGAIGHCPKESRYRRYTGLTQTHAIYCLLASYPLCDRQQPFNFFPQKPLVDDFSVSL